MSTTPLPLRQHSGLQEDLIWWANESDGALGRKSVQGAIQARLEGGTGVHNVHDLLEAPDLALQEVIHRTSFRAADRLKHIVSAWKLCTTDSQRVLAAVYHTPLHPGLDAFGSLGNAVPLSKIAVNKYKASRTQVTFGEWVTRLSARYVIYTKKSMELQKIRANSQGFASILQINRDIETLVSGALETYAEARRRVENPEKLWANAPGRPR